MASLAFTAPNRSADEQLSYERHARPRAALVAAVAGIALLAAAVVQSTGPQPKVSEITVQLLVTHQRAGLEVLGAVLDAVGLLGLAGTLLFMFSVVRARRPEFGIGSPGAAIVGALLAAVGGVAYGFLIIGKASDFASQGGQTYPQANHLLTAGPLVVLQYAGLAGALVLAIGFIMIALTAMRVGLLTRFLGYLGIVAAAASMLLAGSPPALILQIFWLLALAYLLSGRWPSGSPPAWQTGRAEPWPSGAAMREQRVAAQAARGGRGGRGGRRGGAPAADEPKAVAPATPQSGRSAAGTKRKRKRRR